MKIKIVSESSLYQMWINGKKIFFNRIWFCSFLLFVACNAMFVLKFNCVNNFFLFYFFTYTVIPWTIRVCVCVYYNCIIHPIENSYSLCTPTFLVLLLFLNFNESFGVMGWWWSSQFIHWLIILISILFHFFYAPKMH